MYVCTPVCFMCMKVIHGHMVLVYTLLYACSVCLAENCMCGSFLCVSHTQSVLCVHMVCVLVWICWHRYATTELKVKQFSITCPKSSCLTAFWSLTYFLGCFHFVPASSHFSGFQQKCGRGYTSSCGWYLILCFLLAHFSLLIWNVNKALRLNYAPPQIQRTWLKEVRKDGDVVHLVLRLAVQFWWAQRWEVAQDTQGSGGLWFPKYLGSMTKGISTLVSVKDSKGQVLVAGL